MPDWRWRWLAFSGLTPMTFCCGNIGIVMRVIPPHIGTFQELNLPPVLGEIAKANPGVAIGSYPFFDPQHGPNTNVVLRAHDAQKLALAKRAVEYYNALPAALRTALGQIRADVAAEGEADRREVVGGGWIVRQ